MIKKRLKKKVVVKRDADSDSKLYAFLAVFFTIIGFLIAFVLKKDNKYVMFYAKHGLILFIGQVLVGVVGAFSIVGWFFIGPVLWTVLIVLWVVAWLNALSGKQKETFIITELAEKINL